MNDSLDGREGGCTPPRTRFATSTLVALLAALFCAALLPGTAIARPAASEQQPAAASASSLVAGLGENTDSTDYMAQGAIDECTYTIDQGYNLVIAPTNGTAGHLSHLFGLSAYSDKIRSVSFRGTVRMDGCNGLFNNYSKLASVDLTGLDISNATTMSTMFRACASLETIDLSPLDTSNVTNMENLFSQCSHLKSINFGNIRTGKVKTMGSMFYGCSSLKTVDLSRLDTSSLESMTLMFSGCPAAESVDFSKFDTSHVVMMSQTFQDCGASTLDTVHLNTENARYMSSLFSGCSKLTELDLSSFKTSNVTDTMRMFKRCTNLKTVKVGSGWDMSNVTSAEDMFRDCDALEGANGTTYKSAQMTGVEYARVDTPSAPGYLWMSEGASQPAPTPSAERDSEKASVKTPAKRTSIAKATVALAKRSYAYNGKAHTPSVKVKLGTTTLKAGRDYTVQYAKGRKAVGTYSVTVKGIGTYTSKATSKFTVRPKVPRMKTLRAHKNSDGSSGFVASWTKIASKRTGYVVRWSPSKTFAKRGTCTFAPSSAYAKKGSAALCVRTKAWLGRAAYVQVRAYQTVAGTKYYSSWSAAKRVVLKR